jgi:hypothetical protein
MCVTLCEMCGFILGRAQDAQVAQDAQARPSVTKDKTKCMSKHEEVPLQDPN